MLQKEMIGRFREACNEEGRIVAALMFGSFVIGEGDTFSDIEFAVFIHDDCFQSFEQRSWLDTVSPVAAYFPDDFGHHTALFANGIRGEFHFMRESDIPIISTWQGYGWFPSLDAAVLLDRSGELSNYASALVGGPPMREGAPLVEGLALNLISLMLFGANLLNLLVHGLCSAKPMKTCSSWFASRKGRQIIGRHLRVPWRRTFPNQSISAIWPVQPALSLWSYALRIKNHGNGASNCSRVLPNL